MVSFVGAAPLAAFHGVDGTTAWFSTRVTNLVPSGGLRQGSTHVMQPTTSSGSRLRTRAVGISERIDAKHATLAEADGFRARNHGASARAHIAGDSSGRVGDRNARHRSEPAVRDTPRRVASSRRPNLWRPYDVDRNPPRSPPRGRARPSDRVLPRSVRHGGAIPGGPIVFLGTSGGGDSLAFHLATTDEKRERVGQQGGWEHFGIHVPDRSADRVDAAVERVKAASGRLLDRGEHAPGVHYA